MASLLIQRRVFACRAPLRAPLAPVVSRFLATSSIIAQQNTSGDSIPDRSIIYVSTQNKLMTVMGRIRGSLESRESVKVQALGQAIPLAFRSVLSLEKYGISNMGDVKVDMIKTTRGEESAGKEFDSVRVVMEVKRSNEYVENVAKFEKVRVARMEQRLLEAQAQLENRKPETESD